MARGRCSAPEDCVQEAFIQLARQDPVPDAPLAWLYQVVRNEAVNQVRSQERRRYREHRVAQRRSAWFEQNQSQAGFQVDVEQLQAALQRLDHETRDIVVASIWSKLTFREISEALDISKATVQRRYQRGIELLRELLSVTCDERTC